MNILYLDHYAGSPSLGMEYRPFYLAREWQRLGNQVAIVAASYAHVRTTNPNVADLVTVSQVEGLPFVWLRTPTYHGNGLARVRNMLAYLRGLRQWRRWLPFTPDVIIASSTYPMDIGPARAMAQRTGATLIWEVHDLWPLSPMELGGMAWWHPFILWVQHYGDLACRCSDAVVSLLPLAHLHLTTRGMLRERFHHIPNGVDIDPQAHAVPIPAQVAEVISEARRDGRFLVAYTGAHGPANALDALIDCVNQSRDERVLVLLIGSGPEKARLQVRAAGCPRLRFLDSIPKGAVDAVLRSVDVAFVGHRKQALYRFGISPNKLMDYMLAGVPIISAIAAGNDPVSEANCGLTIEPDSPTAIAAAFATLQRMSTDERRSMGQRGREHILRHQTYPVLAQRFLDIMQDLRHQPVVPGVHA